MKGSAKIDKERRGGCSQILAVEEGGNDTNRGDERDRFRISRAAQDARCNKRRFGTKKRDFTNMCTEPREESRTVQSSVHRHVLSVCYFSGPWRRGPVAFPHRVATIVLSMDKRGSSFQVVRGSIG